MIPLPIVDRELRVASRKRSTFHVRLTAALVALILGAGILILSTTGFGGGAGTGSLGRGLFATLTWLSLAAALGSGLFLTADCLSEEKREGTLGFLFLTDLRGYDVVLGKLLATSLRGFYALLAVFPILGITLVLGGVTGDQFWKTTLALVSALFVSLTAGLLVSAISRDSQKALAATLLLLLLLCAAGPGADALIAEAQGAPFDPVLALSSPVYLFQTASAWGRTPFWLGLLVNQGIGWTLFGVTCHLIPRTWQERVGAKAGGAQKWRYGRPDARAALRGRLLAVNPVLWLSCRERWQSIVVWAVAVVTVTGFVATWAGEGSATGYRGWMVWNSVRALVVLGLYLGVAAQAGRLLVDGRRSGLLELLLVTPLPVREIVHGHWRALVRMIWLPLFICVASEMAGTFLAQQAQQQAWSAPVSPPPPPSAAATNRTTTTATTNTTTTTTTFSGRVVVQRSASASRGTAPLAGSAGGVNQLVPLLTTMASTLTMVANLVALTWFGMWMGLTSKNASLSTLKTLLFVEIIPWFVITFASAMAFPLLLIPRFFSSSSPSPGWMVWYPLIAAGIANSLSLGKDIGFVVWSRRKLLARFRDQVMPTLTPSGTPPPRSRGLQPGPPPLPGAPNG